MAEGKKYIVISPEVYEVLLMKVETPVNPIASTIKQTQENLNIAWNHVEISEEEKLRLHADELSKLRRPKMKEMLRHFLYKKLQ